MEDIPTHPKYEWSSTQEKRVFNMLDEKTKEYRKQKEDPFSWQLPCSVKFQQDNPNTGETTTNKQKTSKFGNFMGKLLLKSSTNASKIKKSVPKPLLVEKKDSTEMPLTGYFRFMKRRTHHSNTSEDNGFPKINFKFSTARVLGNENTQIVGLNTQTNIKPKYRLINGKRTRWDVVSPVANNSKDEDSSLDLKNKEVVLPQDQSQEPTSSTEKSDMREKCIDFDFQYKEDFNDDVVDDGSSLGSLQSDDDVLGPWIELGMFDSNVSETKKSDHFSSFYSVDNQQNLKSLDLPEIQCLDCKLRTAYDKKPLDISNLCLSCQNKWSDTLSNVFRKFEFAVLTQTCKEVTEKPKSKKVKVTNDNKKASVEKNDVLHKEKTGGEKLLPQKLKKSPPAIGIPPTKSNYTRKTNKKMATGSSKKNDIPKKTNATAKPIVVATPETNDDDDPPFGFCSNPRGLVYKQVVEVLNINGHWYRGTLELMDKRKVKVKYIDWDDQEEWVIIGSKRLRTIQLEDKESDQQTDQQMKSKGESTADEVSKNNPIYFRKIAAAVKSKEPDDYVSSTLDKDPTQIFNDNEVFMTRRLAQELVDEHGFMPNSFGYRRNRAVAVTFYTSSKQRKQKEESVGYLREMHKNQVRVWYPDLHQSEWLLVGSRRLRILTEEEEESILFDSSIDLDRQEVPKIQEIAQIENKIDEIPIINPPPKRSRGRPKKTLPTEVVEIATEEDTNNVYEPEQVPQSTIILEKKVTEEHGQGDEAKVSNFLTTGAFATRRAMRQLTDQSGFVPNPYGYTNNQAVEVLNTRSGKKKFWEFGRLVEMKPGKVRVHYEGWSDLYDEWIMVGSRRIRVAQEQIPQKEDNDEVIAAPVPKTNDLLMTELNPEIRDEVKRNKKHKILSAKDYQELGLLVNIEELAAKELRKKKLHEKKTEEMGTTVKVKAVSKTKSKKSEIGGDKYEDEHDDEDIDEGDLDNDYQDTVVKKRLKSASKFKRKVKKSKTKIAKQTPCEHHSPSPPPANDTQVISLRLAQARASNSQSFVANVYGYDYMQHVTVLHLDKKFYEGRLVSMRKNKIKVHYCGWLDAFDEYITCGSRRLQVIENDHEVVCIEPNFKERYESMKSTGEPSLPEITPVNRIVRKRITLDDVCEEDSEGQREYHKEPSGEGEDEEELVEMDAWKVYCNQCNIVIKQFRYYCTYCETPSAGCDYHSFELCLRCFDQNFPFWHDHPRSSFAIQAVIDKEVGPMPIKGELVTVWEEDVLEESVNITNEDEEKNGEENIEPMFESKIDSVDASKVFSGDASITTDQGYKYLKRWKRRKVCAFCNDDDDTSNELGQFIGPFIIATFNKNGVEKKRSFWAHDSCARYSPEVFCTPEGKWYNVTLALRRGRGMRCYGCKEKGATIGCFESKCSKSFHLPCSQKPASYFKNGVIFWCQTHEAYYNKKDTYVNIFNCDGCSKKLEEETWFTCVQCATSYFSTFDLCVDCYEKFPADHRHGEEDFEETSLAILKEMEAQKATEAAREKEELRAANARKKKKSLFPRRRRKLPDGSTPVSCCYCGTYEAETWRKGYDGGVIMCNTCFELALLIDNDGDTNVTDMPLVVDNDGLQQRYVSSIEDYSHKPYFTREALSSTKFSDASTGRRLESYEPQPNQYFSLTFDSSYFDIPGRAPRWATHSGTDYHGTWLPQTVRRAILKYTVKDERVLSNFLGRGTDAIECFLLQRRCCGIDINPAAVSLSQRNCCFEIPPGLTSAEYRPIVAQADARQLTGSLFGDESFHHVLSHPPYKDCVAYSTHIDGDLSRYTHIDDFKVEYNKVVKESWRLLKMSRRLTLGIGDNREHCFYIPVGFHLIRLYIDQGFELEELVIKRQRYCSAFGLGTYLCVQFDFLVFTHEFIGTFKKIPLENIDRMLIKNEEEEDSAERASHVRLTSMQRGVPSSAILRKSVVMGTVWVFRPTESFRFSQLCTSRMVERFGKDDNNWEHIELDFSFQDQPRCEQIESCHAETEKDQSIDEEESPLSEYEQQRLRRIEENNKTLLKLGLISELSEESNDVIHYENMMDKAPLEDGKLVLMITAHQTLAPCQINLYRKTIVQLAKDATKKLAHHGMLIIGTQDIRNNTSGKLWPMTMLVLEDIERAVDQSTLKLKEMVVTVPDGYSKNRKQNMDEQPDTEHNEEEIDIETVDDYVPIVHAVYLVFQRL
ncbi:hypothetical protein K501DRAFT_327341 [Backusella circina FSU 941]|nr:hypothetical protein K501DRAFT_327341 [Backusella circina FSU 941]